MLSTQSFRASLALAIDEHPLSFRLYVADKCGIRVGNVNEINDRIVRLGVTPDLVQQFFSAGLQVNCHKDAIVGHWC